MTVILIGMAVITLLTVGPMLVGSLRSDEPLFGLLFVGFLVVFLGGLGYAARAMLRDTWTCTATHLVEHRWGREHARLEWARLTQIAVRLEEQENGWSRSITFTATDPRPEDPGASLTITVAPGLKSRLPHAIALRARTEADRSPGLITPEDSAELDVALGQQPSRPPLTRD